MRSKTNLRKLIALSTLFLTFMGLLEGCNTLDMIPVIGLDEDGNPAQIQVPHREYSKRLVAMTQDFQDTTIPILSRRERASGFQIRTIAIGIGANAQIGFGPFKIGAFPHCRLIFSNSSDPSIP